LVFEAAFGSVGGGLTGVLPSQTEMPSFWQSVSAQSIDVSPSLSLPSEQFPFVASPAQNTRAWQSRSAQSTKVSVSLSRPSEQSG
jgi:hypothetical protein